MVPRTRRRPSPRRSGRASPFALGGVRGAGAGLAERAPRFSRSGSSWSHPARPGTVVGDFNDWDPAATPLRRASDGVWSVTRAAPPGRYRYTFIVDGTRWRRDPAAPPALGDDFGTPTSVITVAQR